MADWKMSQQFPEFKTHVMSRGRVFVQCKHCWFFDPRHVEVRHPKQVFKSAADASAWMREHQHAGDRASAEAAMRDHMASRV